MTFFPWLHLHDFFRGICCAGRFFWKLSYPSLKKQRFGLMITNQTSSERDKRHWVQRHLCFCTVCCCLQISFQSSLFTFHSIFDYCVIQIRVMFNDIPPVCADILLGKHIDFTGTNVELNAWLNITRDKRQILNPTTFNLIYDSRFLI